MGICALGYIGLEVTDLEAWRPYATSFLGLMDASRSDAELRLRADVRSWRISVTQGKSDDLAFAGFEVRDASPLGYLRFPESSGVRCGIR